MSTTNILDLNNRIDALEKIAHDVEPIQQQIDELKAWTDPGTKDASGNPIILTDGAELEPTALTVTLEESEDGYSECIVNRDSKNLLPMTVAEIKAANTAGTWNGDAYTVNSVTFTILTDSDNNVIGFDIDGKAQNGNATLYLFKGDISSLSNVILNGCPQGGSNNTYNIFAQLMSSPYTIYGRDTGSGVSIASMSANTQIVIAVFENIELSHSKFYPMIRLASVSDASFEPYQHDTASISFGETINAGSVDFITGIVTVTEPEAKTLTLTPDNITLLKGNNVIRSAGNIDISYHPDNLYSVELIMDNRIAALEEKISILAGGTTGQVLTKTSDNNYDATWATLPANRTTTKKSEK